MAPRTLASLAHALNVAPDLHAALVALGEGLGEVDRAAQIALVLYDGRRDMLAERLAPSGGAVSRAALETTFDHLPVPVRTAVTAGAQFVDLGDRSSEYARLLGFPPIADGGLLAVRGLIFDGALSAVLALYEPRKFFGTRASERFAAAVALFDLGYARFAEREARTEAVRTLEDVTQRVHGEYVRKLAGLEQQLADAARPDKGRPAAQAVVAVERETAWATEEVRRASSRSQMLEQQVTAAVAQLEQAHVELHRRHEQLRQQTRTLYLIDRVLTLDAAAEDPRVMVDGILRLVGDDMQAQRCSLMLRDPGDEMLYVAGVRGIDPNALDGTRLRLGEGVAGRVAESREPLLVQDVAGAQAHPLLSDQLFTTGSFIVFPLVYHGELVGVLNLTNRAQRGVYTEEDVERVRLLALVVSLVAARADLPRRLAAPAAIQ
jgi:hypothetical protein